MFYEEFFVSLRKNNGDSYSKLKISHLPRQFNCEQSQTKDKWFSEIRCLPCVEGLTHFLKDKFNEDINFDIEEFTKAAIEIQELRGLLYERFNNKPKEDEESREFHYHIFGKVLEKLLNDFANKYKLYLNKD